jgi:hypothetical protein
VAQHTGSRKSSPGNSGYFLPFTLNGTTPQESEDATGPAESGNIIPESLRDVYAEVTAKALELRREGKTFAEVCERLNRLGHRTRTGKPRRHRTQLGKLLQLFGSGADLYPAFSGRTWRGLFRSGSRTASVAGIT